MQLEQIEKEIDSYVRRRFRVAPDDPGYDRDADLYEDGYIDSLGFAELTVFLEERFGVTVEGEDVVSDDFSSVAGISRIVERLSRAGIA